MLHISININKARNVIQSQILHEYNLKPYKRSYENYLNYYIHLPNN